MNDKAKNRRNIVILLLMLGVFFVFGIMHKKDSMASETVLETNVAEASSGNVMVGVPGTFYSTEENEMLAYMNEVRKEAYDEHIEYPKGSGKHLGVDYTYVPLKWSNSLENIARIRAAECSMLEGHSRPSGNALVYNGFSANGEVIAWNTNVLNAIRNKDDAQDGGSWYSEKQYYIDPNDSGHVTGHYTAMIDPGNRYVGISGFKGDYSTSAYGNYLSIAGEFSTTASSLDESFVGIDGRYIQKVEVKADYVTLNINGDNVVSVGNDAQLELKATVKISNSDGSYNCPVYTPAVWSIDDETIATVDSSTGKVTAKKSGATKVNAKIVTGSKTLTASMNIIVLENGVTIDSLETPEMITVNTGTKPDLPKTVKANLSNGKQIDVVVSWADMHSGYYETDSYNYWQNTQFNVEGTFKNLTVIQKVKVIAQIKKIVLSTNSVTTDSGVKPELPIVEDIILTNGLGYVDPNTNWTWNLKDEYKSRLGGDFEIEGSYYFNKTKTATFTLHVNPATVTDVTFSSDGATITTESGTAPDYPKATVTWSNGDVTEEDITWVSPEPSTSYTDLNDVSRKYMMKDGGTYTLSGSYNGKSTTVKVKVNPASVTDVALNASDESEIVPCGTAPAIPEKANATWSNGDKTKEVITWGWNPDSEGDHAKFEVLEGNTFDMEGTCKGFDVTKTVTVLPATIESVDSLNMVKTVQGLAPKLPETANVHWSNGTTREEPITWNSIPASSYATPNTEFNVSGTVSDFDGNKYPVQVTVHVDEKRLVGIKWEEGSPTSFTSYYQYNKSDFAGRIIAEFDNGTFSDPIDVTPDMITGFDASSTAGTQEITVSYTVSGVTKELKAEMKLIKRVGIEVATLPAKTEYIEDQNFSTDGIVINEILDDGTHREIPAKDYDQVTYDGFVSVPETYGKQTITCSVYGFTDTFEVSVSEKVLESLSIDTNPDKWVYVQGQSLDLTGIKVSGHYNNGKTYDEAVTADDVWIRSDIESGDLGEHFNTDKTGMFDVYIWKLVSSVEEGGAVSKNYVGDTFMVEIIPRESTSAEWEKMPSKTSFPQNDVTFDDYGFKDGKLKINYNDDTSEIVDLSEATISGFDITKVGKQTVTVTYDKKKVTFEAEVTVPEVVKTYAVAPTKVGYAEGETLELDGAKIVFAYNNGLTDEIDVDPENADTYVSFSDGSNITAPLSGDSKILIVSYKGAALNTADNKDITINISKRTGIRVTKAPNNVIYPEGTGLSKISLDGIQLEAVFENGSTSIIPSKDYALSDNDDYNSSVLGKHSIEVEAYGFTTSFEITLRERRITSIEVNANPLKTEYVQGQAFDINGLSVKAYYDNDTSGKLDVTANNVRVQADQTQPFDVTKLVPFTTEKKTSSAMGVLAYVVVTVKYDGETKYFYDDACALYVYDKEVQSIAITKEPAKKTVPQNLKDFSYNIFSDGKLTAQCNCDYTEVLGFSDGAVTLSGLDITKTGVQSVTVSYGGKTATFDVEVTEPVIKTKTVTPPTKTSYSEGEKISLAGAAVVKTYDNGLTETIDLSQNAAALEAEGIKVCFVDEKGNEYAVDDLKVTTTPGAKTLMVKYRTSAEGEPEEYEEIKMPGGTSVKVDVKEKTAPVDSSGGNSGGNNGGNSGSNGNGGNNTSRNTIVTGDKGTQYVKADGSYARSEWITVNGKLYYFNSDSYAASSEWRDGKWINADGTCTYSGELLWKSDATGWWVEDTVGWYPTNSWQKIDGVWYYFNASGYMASGEYYDGYWFNKDGSWDPQYKLSWKGNSTGWWVEDISGWWPSSSWLKVDGYWYYFDASGYMVTNQYVDGYWISADGVCY